MSRPSPLHEEHLAAGARLADIDGGLQPVDFGDPRSEYEALRSGAGLADLARHGRLRIRGADRASFLHNMVTNDVLGLRPGQGCNAAKLTLQGKMEAGLHVLCFEDEIWCELEAAPAAALQAALERHRIMEDASIEDVTAESALLTVQGPRASAALQAAGVETADLDAELRHAVRRVGGVEARVVRLDRSGAGGFDVWVATARAGEVWRALRDAGGARPVGCEALEVRRIEAGIPRAGAEVTGEYFPMEAGLEVGWISYTKGCYLGQETISRLHHLGHVNRYLRGLVLDGDEVPSRGSAVRAGDDRVGEITSSARSPHLGRAIALAYVHRTHAEPGTELVVETASGRAAARVVLVPFA